MAVKSTKELEELMGVDWSNVSSKLEELFSKVGEKKSKAEIVNEELEEILDEYRGKGDSLIEVLHKAQELIGFIPKAVQIKIARGLNVSPSEVSSVISFYSYFSERSKGKFQLALCKGTACYVKGSAEIIEKIREKYNIESGETTEDGLISLEVVRCLGACGLAPVMTVNGKAYGLLNPEKAVMIIEKYKNEEI